MLPSRQFLPATRCRSPLSIEKADDVNTIPIANMGSMKRRVSKWLTLCVGTTILLLWPVSRRWYVSCWVPPSKCVDIRAGFLIVGTLRFSPGQGRPTWIVTDHPRSNESLLRFHWYSDPTDWYLTVPLWMLAAPVLLTSTALFVCRPKPPGTCTNCGYDQTGLAAAAMCPECGEKLATVD